MSGSGIHKLVLVNLPTYNLLKHTSPLFRGMNLYHLKYFLNNHSRYCADWNVEILNFEDFQEFGRSIIEEADLVFTQAVVRESAVAVGFGLFSWNLEASIRLAQNLKLVVPEVLLIAGGPELSDRPGFVQLSDAFDVLVEGPGEYPLEEILRRTARGDVSLRDVPNVSFREPSGDYHHNESRRLELAPWTNLEVIKEHNSQIYGEGFYQAVKGCRNRCSYCLWTDFPNSSKSIEIVEDELNTLLQDTELENLVLFDYDIVESNSTIDITDTIIKQFKLTNTRSKLASFVNTQNIFNPSIQKMIENLPVSAIFVGMQSRNTQALRRAGRAWTIASKDNWTQVPEAFRRLYRPEMMFPLPGEKPAEALETMRYLLDLGFYRLQFFQVMVLRGTALHRRADELGLVFQSRPPYFCLATPQSNARETLEVSAVGTALTLLGSALHRAESVLRKEFHRPYGSELVDRIYRAVREGQSVNNCIGTILSEFFGVPCEGRFMDADFRNETTVSFFDRLKDSMAQQHPDKAPELAEVRLESEISVATHGFPLQSEIKGLIESMGISLDAVRSDAGTVVLNLRKGEDRLQLQLSPGDSDAPFYREVGGFRLSYGGNAIAETLADRLVDLVRMRSAS